MATARLADRLFTPKKAIPRKVEWGVNWLIPLAILLGWTLLGQLGLVREDFLPSPVAVARRFVQVAADGTLLKHTLVSLNVIIWGFVLSSLVAVPLGVLMGSFRIVAAAVEPVVNFMRYLPVTSMIPLLILWIGIGIEQKIAVIFLGTFFQQLVMFADVSRQVPEDLYNVSYTLGATRGQVIRRVMLPATLPGVMDTLRVTMGWAWTYLVVAELVAADAGLGYMSLQGMRGFDSATIFVAIFVIGFLGLITDLLFKILKDWALPWTHIR
ncbi:MAG: ABC transporter permease [Paracoccaceae bacterium]